MSLPQPKELIKKVAEFHDSLMEMATKPFKDLASSLNLPALPEPPKATELVESLPELPLPAPAKAREREKEEKPTTVASEVSKIKVEEKAEEEKPRFKVV